MRADCNQPPIPGFRLKSWTASQNPVLPAPRFLDYLRSERLRQYNIVCIYIIFAMAQLLIWARCHTPQQHAFMLHLQLPEPRAGRLKCESVQAVLRVSGLTHRMREGL